MNTKQNLSLAAALFAAVQLAAAADITGTVTLKGTPPPETPNTKIMDDPICGKFYTETPTTHHYVVSAGGGLANVVVMLKGVTGKSTGASAPAFVIDQKNCQYSPQIFAVQTGQPVSVKNSDPTLHNIHTTPAVAGNEEQNKPQMAGSPDLNFSFPKEEIFLKFKCDVHPWMFAWVTVVDSPYFAVTDKDGKFTIKDVPPGKYTVTALHRKASPAGTDQEIEVKADGAKADFALEVPAAK
jgi:plastocyanin